MQRKRIIPMDGPIKEFDKHLRSHPRTILSARFGDGKSYFLSAAEKKLKEKYVFLKLYPVNYQVAENQDIFEYIKRDLLFQLYGQGMVPDSYEIPDRIASFFFVCNNWDDFASEILKGLSSFDASNTMKVLVGAIKFLGSMKKKYDEFKKNGGEIGVQLDRFISKFDEKGIYEADPITNIICDIIKEWKQVHSRKKVCLVFEDMDRIDPAHIFRILNVISAHMDYGYKYFVSPSSNSLVGNKFGVDNIVVCLDYYNLRNIFYHFYGSKACFEGYINKFTDKGIFHYSLSERVYQFYLDELIRITGMNNRAVSAIANQINFTTYTLRQFYHAADGVGKQITLPSKKAKIIPHRGMYIVVALLRRLGLSDEDIMNTLAKAFVEQPEAIGPYLVTSMMLRRNVERATFSFSFGLKEDRHLVRYLITDINQDGCASLESRQYLSWNPSESYCKPEEEMGFILEHVNK